MRLIDADVLIEAMKKTESEYENAMTCPSWWSAFNVISEQPTAYDIDKVVEELENNSFITVKQEEVQTKRKDIHSFYKKKYAILKTLCKYYEKSPVKLIKQLDTIYKERQ